MPLATQCEKLSIRLDRIQLPYVDRPEVAALNYFEAQGYIGTKIEGFMFHNVLKALMLDKLAKFNTFNLREDACSRYLQAQFVICKDDIDEIIDSIQDISRLKFSSNLIEVINQIRIAGLDTGVSFDVGLAIFDSLSLSVFAEIARIIAEDPYKNVAGWPDLTLVKDNKIELIEVKTTDRLHKNQLHIIPILKSVLPDCISVLQITKL
ncbi:VRR-NUC domain-containing protein [Psychrobacter sp. ASPA161_9]|uniref:VRR-NUC domain-containing protein n=1 Tax=Psychrobacter sp. ASPA161_9 TaxID=3160961 RepID=UPI003F7D26FA